MAFGDPDVVARYRAKIVTVDPYECWFWTGAVTTRGHGRFWIGNDHSPAGAAPGSAAELGGTQLTLVHPAAEPTATAPAGVRNFTVIAHRFGYGLLHGFDALMDVEVVAHRCDNPLCQRPAHWCESTHAANKAEWAARRHQTGDPGRAPAAPGPDRRDPHPRP